MHLQPDGTPFKCIRDEEDFEIDVEDESEKLELYEKRFYYPICINEVLVGRYRIEHKLGYGGFSTVWMAHDLQMERDVALKILMPGPKGEHEYAIQSNIIQTVNDTSGLNTYLDTFLLPGYECDHRVLVLPMLGPSLSHGCNTLLRKIPVATRMSAAKQLLKALKALHGGGFVHRDITPSNIMWGLEPTEKLSIDAKYARFGLPRKIVLPEFVNTWKPGELVAPMDPPQSLLSGEVFIGDFGISIKSGTQVKEHVLQPIAYCAPERFHKFDPSPASDMWSFMCIFTELYLVFPAFGKGFGVLRPMVWIANAFGGLPAHWKGHYSGPGENDDSWYDMDREPKSHSAFKTRIEKEGPPASLTEREHVLSVMSKGFQLLPEKRITAEQLLEDPSFKAIMEIYGV